MIPINCTGIANCHIGGWVLPFLLIGEWVPILQQTFSGTTFVRSQGDSGIR